MISFIKGAVSAAVKIVTLPVTLPITAIADLCNSMDGTPSKTAALFESIGRDLDEMTD